MLITQKDVKSFKKLYQEKYGRKVDDRTAKEIMERLISLIILIYGDE